MITKIERKAWETGMLLLVNVMAGIILKQVFETIF